ncbi:hypothetical protein [Fuerstiella marisgermanici]|uniref:Uncharacterized protein n=1 Tax=Fuerstiella marisgermanici TaxID=1891926 RepID=A0A1P8WIY7_9PLAN|nr:hypothetical protein [Fuerstiella marisgermanici]APZ94025.1 hypothetical protein Fuma_03643 [Fuerstiella marisgermanici]
MSLRFRICLAAWIAVVALAAMSGQVQAQDGAELTPIPDTPAPALPPENAVAVPLEADSSYAEWTIEIVPAHKVRDASEANSSVAAPADSGQAAAGEGCPTCGHATANAADYTRIYKSIPFNRAEYDVNPSYRHDSAMEILTGNARHKTVVHHGTSPKNQPVVVQPSQPTIMPYPFDFIRPSLRRNYYRFFPSMNPYYNRY